MQTYAKKLPKPGLVVIIILTVTFVYTP